MFYLLWTSMLLYGILKHWCLFEEGSGPADLETVERKHDDHKACAPST
jgi:hypothetical protein